ncbi:acyl-CoA thioesterase II [Janibacter sp. YB324]|uniref:acyl-CoA thioesterase n=1 Tax=Janibacter sp. YB324 TaxID=2761047 RepID=UPI0016275FB0|nr:acyl-CoA thioesterase II [Janibacter sp. YB324]QNF93235.1 acyl-CoA thioesterase II [Janibacter sp. YB324]
MAEDSVEQAQRINLSTALATLELQEVGHATIRVEGADGVGELGASSADVFEGESIAMPHGRVFGGQVLAQALMAAGRTVLPEMPHRMPHSLHAYFMRPGDSDLPIRFAVERMRDGRSFSTRRVHALQHGRPILSMTASFQDPSDGLDHQVAAPDVPSPDDLESIGDSYSAIDHPRAKYVATRPVDHRYVDGDIMMAPAPEQDGHQRVWFRTIAQLPHDQLTRCAVLAFASDYTPIDSMLRAHGLTWSEPGLTPATIDHTIWFHRPVDPGAWLLYDQESPSTRSGRGLMVGKVFTEEGVLVATIAQEAMVRIKPVG